MGTESSSGRNPSTDAYSEPDSSGESEGGDLEAQGRSRAVPPLLRKGCSVNGLTSRLSLAKEKLDAHLASQACSACSGDAQLVEYDVIWVCPTCGGSGRLRMLFDLESAD